MWPLSNHLLISREQSTEKCDFRETSYEVHFQNRAQLAATLSGPLAVHFRKGDAFETLLKMFFRTILQ